MQRKIVMLRPREWLRDAYILNVSSMAIAQMEGFDRVQGALSSKTSGSQRACSWAGNRWRPRTTS